MSRLTRDGTTKPVSRDLILRRERGQVKTIFPVQLTTSRIDDLTRLILTLYYNVSCSIAAFTKLLTSTFHQSSHAWASARTLFTSDIASHSDKEVQIRERSLLSTNNNLYSGSSCAFASCLVFLHGDQCSKCTV